MGNELRILGAGAVKPGLSKVVDEFRRDTGIGAAVFFAPAPAIRQRVIEGEKADVVIAPPGVLEELAEAEKCTGETVPLGRIGIGVLARNGESWPQIATVAGFKQSLLFAESVVYNRASTGAYLDTLFESLGIGAAVRGKSTRYPDFAAVLDHVSKGNSREIGLGAITVIIENASRGVEFIGPLPPEIQNYTTYAAALTAGSAANQAAQQFTRYFSRPAIKSLLSAAGIQ